MNQLIVVTFDHFDDAKTAMASLRSLERQGRISFEDNRALGEVHVPALGTGRSPAEPSPAQRSPANP